jgi:hypothetical protein
MTFRPCIAELLRAQLEFKLVSQEAEIALETISYGDVALMGYAQSLADSDWVVCRSAATTLDTKTKDNRSVLIGAKLDQVLQGYTRAAESLNSLPANAGMDPYNCFTALVRIVTSAELLNLTLDARFSSMLVDWPASSTIWGYVSETVVNIGPDRRRNVLIDTSAKLDALKMLADRVGDTNPSTGILLSQIQLRMLLMFRSSPHWATPNIDNRRTDGTSVWDEVKTFPAEVQAELTDRLLECMRKEIEIDALVPFNPKGGFVGGIDPIGTVTYAPFLGTKAKILVPAIQLMLNDNGEYVQGYYRGVVQGSLDKLNSL